MVMAGGGDDDENDADDAGIGVQGFVWLRVDEGQPGAAGNAGGRPRNDPAGAAGVVGPSPVAGVVGAPPVVGVIGTPHAVGVVGAPPAADVVDPRPLAHRAPHADTARRVCAMEAPRGRAFTAPINRGRKRHGDDDDQGGMSPSNIMGIMMMQQWRKAELEGRQSYKEGGRNSSLSRGDHNAAQGDGNTDGDAARGESCASADDERHANDDDTKRWWVQSPAAEDGHH